MVLGKRVDEKHMYKLIGVCACVYERATIQKQLYGSATHTITSNFDTRATAV